MFVYFIGGGFAAVCFIIYLIILKARLKMKTIIQKILLMDFQSILETIRVSKENVKIQLSFELPKNSCESPGEYILLLRNWGIRHFCCQPSKKN